MANPMSEGTGAATEAASSAALYFSAASEGFSVTLTINNSWVAGAGLAAVALGAFYLANKAPVDTAIRRAIEKLITGQQPDPEVMDIEEGSLLVKLYCHTKGSFLTFLAELESNKIKRRLEKELKKIGFSEELEVNLVNAEEVYEKAIKLRNVAEKKGGFGGSSDDSGSFTEAACSLTYVETSQSSLLDEPQPSTQIKKPQVELKRATLKHDLEEYLECGVCLEKFEEPKVLTCQHTYCKKCLERLVNGIGKLYKIRCPECGQKSKVPNGDVSKLPSNYLISRLLQLKRSDSKPSCEKHEGEILKLYCQTCGQLICRDCIIFDHRDHKYSFIKDIFAAEKEKIVKAIETSKTNILTLINSIDTLKEQEESLNKNFLEFDQKIDDFVEKQIEILKGKQQSMKDELRKSFSTQKHKMDSEMEYFVASFDYAVNRVEVTEHILSKITEADTLAAKNEMIQYLSDINAVVPHLIPSHDFLVDPPLDEDMAAIFGIATLSLK